LLFIVSREKLDGLGMWHVWGEGSAYRVLLGKAQGKRSLGRPSCRWEDNIKMDLKEMCREYVDSINQR
jgi:hypothetical protein